jgi:putative FmdB family regulatory protein
MPTYVYRCKKCKHQYELFHGITDETPKRCPECRGRTERVPAGGAGILFKGSGFYITDYRSKSYQDKAKQEKPGGSAGATPAAAPAGGAKGGGTSSPGGSGGTSTGKGAGSSKPASGGD